MIIKDIEIRNFRGIKHLEINDLKMLNIFLGKNNVGKTSILEAIFISLSAQNPSLLISIDNFRNLLHNDPEDFRFIFYQLDYRNEVAIKTQYIENDTEKILRITPNLNKTGSIIAQNQISNDLGTLSTMTEIDKTPVSGLKLNFEIKQRHSKREFSTASIEIQGTNNYNVTPAKFVNGIKAVIVTGNTVMANLVPKLEKVIINKQEQTLIEFLGLVDSSIVGITLGSNGLILCDTGFGKRYPLNLLGEGVIKLLAILLAIYEAAGGLVLIDEFSNGLHFTALKSLWKAIFYSAKENKAQIFLTTHHYESLEYLKQVLDEDDYKEFQDDVRSYTIRKLPSGDFKSYTYDYARLNNAIQQEIEIR